MIVLEDYTIYNLQMRLLIFKIAITGLEENCTMKIRAITSVRYMLNVLSLKSCTQKIIEKLLVNKLKRHLSEDIPPIPTVIFIVLL